MPCDEALRLKTELDRVIDARITYDPALHPKQPASKRRRALRAQAAQLLAAALNHKQACIYCQSN